jgi:hypothetical protein
MAFPVPIIQKSQKPNYYICISYTEFYPNCKINVGSTLVRKVWLSLCRLSQNLQILTVIIYRTLSISDNICWQYDKIKLRALGTVLLSRYRVLSTSITRRSCVRNCTHIVQKIRNLRVQINLCRKVGQSLSGLLQNSRLPDNAFLTTPSQNFMKIRQMFCRWS